MCTKCHGTAVFSKMRMGRVGWEDEVAAMVEKGAIGTDQEIQTVVDYMVKNYSKLEKTVYRVPEELDKRVARLKLESMGIKIDRLTPEQEEYLAGWSEGT